MIDKGHWNFTWNSFLQIKLEADITADINSFIQNNDKYLKNINDSQIPVSEQAKHYGAMAAVVIKINISNNETLTLLFSRICYSKTIRRGPCMTPARNYIYVEGLTSNYQKTSYNISSKSGKMIKVPGLLNITAPKTDGCCLGPEDPRVVLDENNQIFLSFNMMDVDKRRKMWLYDIFTDYQSPFLIQNNQVSKVEKNWAPFVKDNKLYFIYSFNPFKILQCFSEKGVCEFISNMQSNGRIGTLRGGTQLVRFRDSDYFVGIARTTTSSNKCQRFYRPHLVVLSTTSNQFHLAYVSESLMLDDLPLFASYFMLHKNKPENFCGNAIQIMTPGSILDWQWPDDKLTFTISINDMRSFIVSVVGIGKIVQNIIHTIETEYSQVFFSNNLDMKMVSYSEAMALNYCESISETSKLIFEKK